MSTDRNTGGHHAKVSGDKTGIQQHRQLWPPTQILGIIAPSPRLYRFRVSERSAYVDFRRALREITIFTLTIPQGIQCIDVALDRSYQCYREYIKHWVVINHNIGLSGVAYANRRWTSFNFADLQYRHGIYFGVGVNSDFLLINDLTARHSHMGTYTDIS